MATKKKTAPKAPPQPASRTIATDEAVDALRGNPSRNLSVPGIPPR